MAVLPLLLQTKAGACRHKDFVQFVLVSFVHFFNASSSKKDSCYFVLETSVLTLQSCDRSLKN